MTTHHYTDTPPVIEPKFDANGLMPAIAQDAETGKVLMLAWMNAESLALTLAEKRAVYWSRSRQSLWRKGESSGNVQELVDIRLDCDGDTLLLSVRQIGGCACHTGRPNCFFYAPQDPVSSNTAWHVEATPLPAPSAPEKAPAAPKSAHKQAPTDTLTQLAQTLVERRSASPETSYVASLHAKGLNKILEKVGEEATEVILAAKDVDGHDGEAALAGEVADLWFHTLVMLSHLGLDHDAILAVLRSRFNLSGLAEKAGRSAR